jgi:hypothetical protein
MSIKPNATPFSMRFETFSEPSRSGEKTIKSVQFPYKNFIIAVAVLFCAGCTSYRITSSPDGAKIQYKGSVIYKPIISQRTPLKARKGIEWPIGYDYVRVEWPGGSCSDWKLLNQDLHFQQDADVIPFDYTSISLPAPVEPLSPQPSASDPAVALEKLTELKTRGLLTDEEYETRRRILIEQL